jgi:hypothetical protein
VAGGYLVSAVVLTGSTARAVKAASQPRFTAMALAGTVPEPMRATWQVGGDVHAGHSEARTTAKRANGSFMVCPAVMAAAHGTQGPWPGESGSTWFDHGSAR